MQNWTNITPIEVVVAGSAMLIICVAPSVFAWGDTRRRRKALARAAAMEAAARAAAVPPPPPATPAAQLMGLQWDEPTVTVDPDVLGAPVVLAEDAAVFEVPPEAPTPPPAEAPAPAPVAQAEAPLMAVAPVVAALEPPQAIDLPPPVETPAPVLVPPLVATPPVAEAPVPPLSAAPEELPIATDSHPFCLQDLRRVRLPNWPPSEVSDDPARSAIWRDAERLATQHEDVIGAAALQSPSPVQSCCLGAAEADASCTRLRFFLFGVLWPSTAEQATAEAVFELAPDGAMLRSYVLGRHDRR